MDSTKKNIWRGMYWLIGRVIDLAKDLICLSGLSESAIEIRKTGMRLGEKLYEELYFDSEKVIRTVHPKLPCA